MVDREGERNRAYWTARLASRGGSPDVPFSGTHREEYKCTHEYVAALELLVLCADVSGRVCEAMASAYREHALRVFAENAASQHAHDRGDSKRCVSPEPHATSLVLDVPREIK